MRIYNDQPKPRALFEDLADDLAKGLRGLFPSVRDVAADDRLFEEEADVLVSSSPTIARAPHMHVVAFGSTRLGQVEPPEGEKWPGSIWITPTGSRATELIVPDGITGVLGSLVHSDLVPLFSAMEEKPTLVLTDWYRRSRTGINVVPWCTPFLVAGDGSVLAAAFTRHDGGRCWVLPSALGLGDPAAWVSAALEEFRQVDPTRVPALPGWWEQPQWATADQLAARKDARDLEAERTRLADEFEQRLIAAQQLVSRADEAAFEGPSRLLTTDGDELANAVQAALESFDFVVEDMDNRFPEGQRREDFRVRDPVRPDWEAIVEVKGYSRGAAVNDLARLARWSARYAADEGRLPDAEWHVVNAFRGMDPSTRPTPIPDDDDLRDFVAAGGLLIDTRQLFSAWRTAANDAALKAAIRESLTTSRGRWRPSLDVR